MSLRRSAPLFLSLALALPATAAKLPALVDAAPADAAAVFYADVASMRGSALASKVIDSGSHVVHCDADADDFLRDLGVDPSKDVDRVLISVRPAAGKGEPPEMLVVAEGRFDAARIGKTLAGRGATPQPVAGTTLYRLATMRTGAPAEGPGNEDRFVVSVPSSGRVVAGTDAEVIRALSGRSGRSAFAPGQPLANLATLARTGSSAWFVVDTDRFVSAADRRTVSGAKGDAVSQAVGSLSSVTAVGGSLDLGRGVDFQLSAKADTEENAELVEDSIRGFLALWRLAAQDKAPDAVSALRKFRVERGGTTSTMSGTLSRADVEKLVSGAKAAAAEIEAQ